VLYTLTVKTISGQVISRRTGAGEWARCVETIMLAPAIDHRAFINICHQSIKRPW